MRDVADAFALLVFSAVCGSDPAGGSSERHATPDATHHPAAAAEAGAHHDRAADPPVCQAAAAGTERARTSQMFIYHYRQCFQNIVYLKYYTIFGQSIRIVLYLYFF